jgi:Icc-related predicted phosphoesterase
MTEKSYLREKIRQALATDPNIGVLNVHIEIKDNRLVLSGEVASLEKAEYAGKIAHALASDLELINELHPLILTDGPLPEETQVRIAASGDLHYDLLSAGKLRSLYSKLDETADFLLLAGDLTDTGQVSEAKILADDLKSLSIPIVAVLGNHDYHSDQEREIRMVLEDAGVTVLEGETTTLQCQGLSVGVAGAKGFGGGFQGACGSPFGEPEMKTFMHSTEAEADRLRQALRSLQTDYKIALVHYAPIRETLTGERLEIYPFLGSYLLAEAIDEGGADLAIHGHAHHGRESGTTSGGIPVHNVAIPLLRKAYALYAGVPRAKKTQAQK